MIKTCLSRRSKLLDLPDGHVLIRKVNVQVILFFFLYIFQVIFELLSDEVYTYRRTVSCDFVMSEWCSVCCRSDEDSQGKSPQSCLVKNAVGAGKSGGTAVLPQIRDVCAAGRHSTRGDYSPLMHFHVHVFV